MKRLFFINRFFFPDQSATSQLLSDLAFHLAEAGNDVHVVTSQLLYDQPTFRLPAEAAVRKVAIHRMPTMGFGRGNLALRAIEYLSFYRAVQRFLLANLRSGDVVVANTDPPLLSIAVLSAVRRKSAKLINWLHDLYPEIAVELGVPLLRGPVERALRTQRNRSLRLAAFNVVLCDRMADRLVKEDIPQERIVVIPNWTDDQDIVPVTHVQNPLRSAWDLAETFVVAYSGNLGRAHEFETAISAANLLRNQSNLAFLFIGSGFYFDELAREVKTRGLEKLFHFRPHQDRADLRYALGVADVHWVSLRENLEGLIFPSKVYGIAAAGRPIIAVADPKGDVTRLITEHGCGVGVRPGDAQSFADAIMALKIDEALRKRLGERARQMLEDNFSRDLAFARWGDVLAASI